MIAFMTMLATIMRARTLLYYLAAVAFALAALASPGAAGPVEDGNAAF